MSAVGREYIQSDGTMPEDWLIATNKHNEPFFGWWGWVIYPFPWMRSRYEELGDLKDDLKEATHAGLARWASTRWAWERGTDLKDLADQPSPITVLIVSVLLDSFKNADLNFQDLNSVVHWGPGSGNYTLMMRHLGARHTEYLIDIPLVSIMQYDFLSRSFDEFGYGEVNLITCEEDEIVEGIPNIVPLPFVDKVPTMDHDLFLAFHSLNESSINAHNYVINERNWFGAEAAMLSWTDNLKELQDGKVLDWGPGVLNWTKLHQEWNDRGILRSANGTYLLKTSEV